MMRLATREQELAQTDTYNNIGHYFERVMERDFQHPDEMMGLSITEDGTSFFAVHTGESTIAVDFCVINEDSTETRWQLKPIQDIDGSQLFVGMMPELAPGTRYGLRAHDTNKPTNTEHLLLDPYAKATVQDASGQIYGIVPEVPVAREIKRPKVDSKDRIIYETHIKGATALHPDVPEELRGTYLGFSHPAHIDYLKKLGVTTVELLPIMQFVNERHLEGLGKANYWGYNPANFFSPHDKYASHPEAGIAELKAMIDALHDENLEVILDVVYNHTADGGDPGESGDIPVISLRGLDESYYHTYQKDGHTRYHNFSGCGNAIDASSAHGHKLIIDSLRYWANEVGVDGFRFDLAATLIRNKNGWLDPKNSPFMKAIREDEDLRDLILIAEPWDVGAYGYARGQFAPDLQETGRSPEEPQWQEWSDTFRDVVRRWNLGEATAGELASVLADPHDTINFITAHDGFTLWDLVSYNQKHNEANGEDNRDGNDNNYSNNRGIEGPTDNPHIIGARKQAVRNMILTLFMSTGTPMINGGDEYLRTQDGNNNAYCQDNETTWHDWQRAELERSMVDFAAEAVALHKRSGVGSDSLKMNMGTIANSPVGEKGIDWINLWGQEMTESDWKGRLVGRYSSGLVSDSGESTLFYANGLPHDVAVSLPTTPNMAGEYELLADTATGRIDREGIGIVPERFVIKAMSSVVLRRISSRLPHSSNSERPTSRAAIISDGRPRLSGDLLPDSER